MKVKKSTTNQIHIKLFTITTRSVFHKEIYDISSSFTSFYSQQKQKLFLESNETFRIYIFVPSKFYTCDALIFSNKFLLSLNTYPSVHIEVISVQEAIVLFVMKESILLVTLAVCSLFNNKKNLLVLALASHDNADFSGGGEGFWGDEIA